DLAVDTFTAGADSVGFVAKSVDADLAGTGYVIATDVTGNADSLAVSIAARPPDVTAPVVSGALAVSSFTGSATEEQADDRGLATVELAAGATNLSLSVDSFLNGATSTTFTASPVDVESAAKGWVVATDVVGNADSVFVEVFPPPDETAPVLVGTVNGFVYDGTATDNATFDSGLATIALEPTSTNLALTVDSFTSGAGLVNFSATLIEPTENGTGYVVATDVAGNADSVFVSIDGAPAFQFDLAAAAAAAFDTETSGTLTVTVSNIGSDPMTDVRVVQQSATGATVDSNPVSLGSIDAGASKDATFAFSNATAGASASFQAQDLVVRFDEGDTVNNDVTISLEPLGDTSLPVLAGSSDGTTYSGTATDDQVADTGIASIALVGGATNLALTVDPFTLGDAAVVFTATFADPLLDASGYVVATDVAGNADSVFVSLVVPDAIAPELTGAYSPGQFDGTATDAEAGISSVTLSADAVNLDLAVDPFNGGDSPVAFVA
ncbi:MAG: hypothetical protein AAFU38_19930, partial [Bacteroidota bacterium]